MNCIMENTSVVPSSNFVDFIHRASRICLGQSAKALVWRWRQICPLKIDIFTLSAPNSTNEVSMFKLAIKVCFENHFGLIHAIFLSLGSTKSGYFFLGHPVCTFFIALCEGFHDLIKFLVLLRQMVTVEFLWRRS